MILRSLSLQCRPKITITYNSYAPHQIFAKACRRLFDSKWINIVADDKESSSADISLFLSYFAYVSSTVRNRIHFDGGVYSFPEKCSLITNSEELVVLFAGALNEWTGIIELVEWVRDGLFAFNPKLKLKIFGKGCVARLKEVANSHPQVQIVGFVDSKVLDEEMRNCWLFINPRPIGKKGGEFNFPSKLFDYMRFGKPILCTPTPGLAPEYLKVFVTYATREQLRVKLEQLTNVSAQEFEKISERHFAFASSKTWRTAVEGAVCSILDILESNFEGFGFTSLQENS
jgi:glycosyltransferase involved in cell wall biosynthesis